jgi:two-component system, OmpR family, osmolarity sensor histidine kinase EnvZ
MERMLDGFLDFARGTSGEQPVACDPRSLAATAVAQARRAGIQVELTEGPPVAPVRLRPDAVARALDNLINNAGRHADTGRGNRLHRMARC